MSATKRAKATGKQPTKEQREAIIKELSVPYGCVKFLCDGYQVTAYVQEVKTYRFGIVLYIDEKLRYEHLRRGSEVGAKFYPEYTHCVFTGKYLDSYRKAYGKRRADRHRRESLVTLPRYYWSSPLQMLRKWAKTCEDVVVLKVGQVEQTG